MTSTANLYEIGLFTAEELAEYDKILSVPTHHANQHLGTEFAMSDIKQKVTIGSIYERAALITSQEEAYAYFDKLVEARMQEDNIPREKAIEIEQTNIGYWSGYQTYEVAKRMQTLFCCVHPFFGSIEEQAKLTSEEVIALGQKLGNRLKNGQSMDASEFKAQPSLPDRFRFSSWLGDE